MEFVELSPEEIAIIQKHRAQNIKMKQHKELSREILKVAYEYLKWLQENGAFTSYSTFCNDFGYEGEHRSSIYESVTSIIRTATDTSRLTLESATQEP